jgi:hypothetical protein
VGCIYDVAVQGSFAYVANAGGGLDVVDITDPANPQWVGHQDSPGISRRVAVSGKSVYLISDRVVGLRVIDVWNPQEPVPMGNVTSVDDFQGVAVSGGYVFVTEEAGLQVYPMQCSAADVAGDARELVGPRLLPVPNPTSGQTAIRLSFLPAARVCAGIYDAGGRRVRRLFDGLLSAGPCEICWDGRDDEGRDLPGGVYVLRVHCGEGVQATQITVVR